MLKGYINIFGRDIPLYGICFIFGIGLAACVAAMIKKRRNIEAFDLAGSAIYTMIGALIGAKLLFVAVSWEQIQAYDLSFLDVMRGGFVFYGGFLGGALGLLIYVKQFKEKLSDYLDVYAVVLPLGHALGRVGCFFGGCCYGMEMQSDCFLCVVYENPYNVFTPKNTPLLAVQLIEAFFLLLIFIGMLILFFKVNSLKGFFAFVYAGIYAILRFVLEFFRGDKERGVFYFSTSQWISLGIVCFVVMVLCIRLYKKRKNRAL